MTFRMTRKHFNALANALNSIMPAWTAEDRVEYDRWWATVRVTADVCESSNPRFNRTLFLRACTAV
jgi:hypothetical protein